MKVNISLKLQLLALVKAKATKVLTLSNKFLIFLDCIGLFQCGVKIILKMIKMIKSYIRNKRGMYFRILIYVKTKID